MNEIKYYTHNPPHLFCDGGKYFITGSTYKQQKYFSTDKAKEMLLSSIRKGFHDEGWLLEDWVILDNHYHIMADSGDNSKSLKSIISSIHRYTATWLNRQDNCSGRRIWYNYWDTLITYERSYFARLNYIWYNPVKHGYCQYAEEYRFGSFRERYLKDKEYLEDIKLDYPWDRVEVYDL